jgi:hypothetical protein
VFLPVQAEVDEHQIRDPEDLRKQMEYVAGNPARPPTSKFAQALRRVSI